MPSLTSHQPSFSHRTIWGLVLTHIHVGQRTEGVPGTLEHPFAGKSRSPSLRRHRSGPFAMRRFHTHGGFRSTPTSFSFLHAFVSSPWAPFSDAGARRRAPRRSLAASPSQKRQPSVPRGRPRCHGRTRSTETASKGQRPLVQRPQKWRPSGQSTSLGGGDMACPGPRPRRVGMGDGWGPQHSVAVLESGLEVPS